MYLPSGDQSAPRSFTPEVEVRLRVIPFDAGTDQTSPLALKTTLSPLGESAAPLIVFDASFHSLRAHG